MSLFLAGIAFLGSACSLLYERVFSKALSFYTGDFVLWQSLCLGSYLLALGFGVFYQAKPPSSWRKLFQLELTLAIFGALCVPFLTCMHGLYRIYLTDFGIGTIVPVRALTCFALTTLPLIASIGFLAGR